MFKVCIQLRTEILDTPNLVYQTPQEESRLICLWLKSLTILLWLTVLPFSRNLPNSSKVSALILNLSLDTGKHAILQDILDHVTMRNLKQVQNIGNQMVTNYCVSDPWFQTLSSRDKVRYETDYQAQGCLPSYDVGCLLILVVKSIKLELPLYWREMGTLISTSYHRC